MNPEPLKMCLSISKMVKYLILVEILIFLRMGMFVSLMVMISFMLPGFIDMHTHLFINGF